MYKNQKYRFDIGKTKPIILNFINDFQLSTRNIWNGKKNIEVIDKTKVLGVGKSNDPKWKENTNLLIKKEKAIRQLLRKCATFNKDKVS